MTPLKIIYNVLGTVFVGLGIAGIVLPLVPTTPFLLLAAACYLRGSERLHDWLLNHRVLGPYIRNIRDKRGLPLRGKVYTIALLWASITVSVLSMDLIVVDVALVLVAIGTTTFLLRLRTLPRGSASAPAPTSEPEAEPEPLPSEPPAVEVG